MASNTHIYSYDGSKSFTLIKWKIRVGSQLFYNSIILSYKLDGVTDDGKDPLLKYKSNVAGTVLQLLAKEGDIVPPGAQLLKIEPCTHPVIMKDLCAECGADLRHLDRENFEKLTSATTFSMVHVVPELKVCLEQAEKLGRDDETILLKDRKLVLLVDLDQTLIHTTNDNVPKDLPDVHHFQLYGQHSPWYHTKLRPGTRVFLENIANFYELHICTFGARLYAHKIAEILDPKRKLFSHRILSRDECFDATSKTGNLKALFPRGDDMVCIIDDREDVWNFAPNVVHVKPYCYFQHTGDINAPPFAISGSNMNNAAGAPLVTAETSTTTEAACSSKEDLQSEKTSDDKKTTETEQNNKVSDNGAAECSPDNDAVASDKNTGKTNKCKKSARTGKRKAKKTKEQGKKSENVGKKSEEQEKKPAEEEKKSKEQRKKGKELEKPKVDSAVKSPENETPKPDIEFPPNDYLLYLEEILQNIHKEYYKIYDRMKAEGKVGIPDLKLIVPEVKRRILKGCNIVFSSVIPTNLHPETSRFWTLAESLGVRVTEDLVLDDSEDRTTHVVASKPGTAKVNAAKRHGGILIVGLDWLFCCAERWERADERLFKLKKDISSLFLDGSKQFEGSVENTFYDPLTGKSLKGWLGSKRASEKKKSRKEAEEEEFSERIFVEAGLSLSRDDIADMDREVEEACSEESDKESQGDSSDSSAESLSSADYPKGWKRPRRDFPDMEEIARNTEESSDVDTIGSVDEEMAEAVKKEFGS